jgi:uncharacterized protein YbaA (DUF1428 family)
MVGTFSARRAAAGADPAAAVKVIFSVQLQVSTEVILMAYVDGFVLTVAKKNLKAYAQMAAAAGKVWKEHGALEFRECAGDDLNVKMGVPFPKMAKAKANETVVFSWIVFKSKAHRDKVNAKVMKDPRLNEMMEGKKMPFDVKRMAYGGFNVLVEA